MIDRISACLLMYCMTFLIAGPLNAASFSASAGYLYFDYTEFGLDGDTLNHETGLLPGLSTSVRQKIFGLTHTAQAQYWQGSVDYNGQTQSGIPLRTQTDQEITALNYRLDWQPDESSGGLYGRIGWQNWDRDIQPAGPISGLFERYRWWALEAGFSLELARNDRQSAFIEIGGLLTTNGTVSIDLQNLGFGRPELDLGDGTGLTVNAGWRQRLGQRSLLALLFDFSRWDFGRSNTRTLTGNSGTITITEPASISKRAELRVEYTYLFGRPASAK